MPRQRRTRCSRCAKNATSCGRAWPSCPTSSKGSVSSTFRLAAPKPKAKAGQVDMADDAERIVPVVIHGQRYPVRSTLQATYVAELAAYVDEKIRVAADENQTNDSLRVAVL